jgi:hypothetical protein
MDIAAQLADAGDGAEFGHEAPDRASGGDEKAVPAASSMVLDVGPQRGGPA